MKFKRFTMIVVATLTVNILLFTGLPNLLPKHSVESEVEQVQMVDFIRQKQGPNENEEKRTPDQPKPPAPPRVVPNKTVNPMAQPALRQIELEMPSFSFDLPLDMVVGVAVDAPTVPAQAVLKDSYGLKEVDQAPVATFKSRPQYPYRARRLNLNGAVDVKFLVDKAGRISRITLLRSAPPGIFDDSVLQALTSWRFAPGKLKGRPVNTWVTTTIEFRIDDL
jgi:protein TonB